MPPCSVNLMPACGQSWAMPWSCDFCDQGFPLPSLQNDVVSEYSHINKNQLYEGLTIFISTHFLSIPECWYFDAQSLDTDVQRPFYSVATVAPLFLIWEENDGGHVE